MTSPRKLRPRGKPPSAGTTLTQSSGLPKFERFEQRQRTERPRVMGVLCDTANAGLPTVEMGHSRRLQSTRIASGLHQKADLLGNFASCSVERLPRRSHKRVEAKRPVQPKTGQGRAAGIAGRAEGASLDRAPVVRQRSSRRSWLGLSQFCEPVCQAANGAICDVDPSGLLFWVTQRALEQGQAAMREH